jgi:23S rRNA pseudouridine1911/1915/1917 synthase
MLIFVAVQKDRLDKFLASQIPQVSRGKIQKAIKDGLALVNGEVVLEADFQLKENDSVSLPEFGKEELQRSNILLKVVFENEDVAVIDKPAGLVVHPGAGNTVDTLANALLTRFPGVETVGEPHRPGIVHRLDEDTSGLILIAKSQTGYEYFKQQFVEHKIEKEYLALVHGTPEKSHDLIDLPLEKVPLKQKMKVGSGKEAKTEYWVLTSGQGGGFDKVALLRVKLHTGRTHQIRAHLSHIGHPIFGDKIYGGEYKSKDPLILNRQFLHAYKLKFQLLDGTWIELTSALPDELKQVLTQANISYDDPKF